MPEPASTRFALVGPTGDTDDIALGDDQINAIIARLEAAGAGFQQGTSRPAASAALEGFFYVDTGTGLVSYCTGSVWIDLQPYDSDLAAIATLSTTSIGRSLLAATDAAALRTIIGTVIGTDVQAHSATLDLLAALSTTSLGRSLLTAATGAAVRTLIGLATTDNPTFGQITATGGIQAVGGQVSQLSYVELPEQADPVAVPDKAFVYARDNGSGKTQLCVQFPTGAVQVIATQP